MPKRLVALSASAVATIYAASLLSTQTAALTLAAPSSADNATQIAVPTSSVASASTATSAFLVGASATSTPVTTSSTSKYADGTYSATGTSRFGNVSVSLTTSGGKIANVQITKVTTSFPVSRIASLPAQVIQNQTSNVNVVTGATYSSQAFKQAVQQALSQALAASG